MMGSLLSCEPCYTRETNSVIMFSDALVLKITEGVEPVEEKRDENDLSQLPDHEWFERIKCIDDSHSAAYGLSLEAFNRLAKKLEKMLSETGEAKACKSNEVLQCYKDNKECELKCQDEVNKYVNCVDLVRLKALKKKMYQMQGKRAEENDEI